MPACYGVKMMNGMKPVVMMCQRLACSNTMPDVDSVPENETDRVKRRSYFDTRLFGKSNKGHTYPNSLSTTQKRAVLEYLKTL